MPPEEWGDNVASATVEVSDRSHGGLVSMIRLGPGSQRGFLGANRIGRHGDSLNPRSFPAAWVAYTHAIRSAAAPDGVWGDDAIASFVAVEGGGAGDFGVLRCGNRGCLLVAWLWACDRPFELNFADAEGTIGRDALRDAIGQLRTLYNGCGASFDWTDILSGSGTRARGVSPGGRGGNTTRRESGANQMWVPGALVAMGSPDTEIRFRETVARHPVLVEPGHDARIDPSGGTIRVYFAEGAADAPTSVIVGVDGCATSRHLNYTYVPVADASELPDHVAWDGPFRAAWVAEITVNLTDPSWACETPWPRLAHLNLEFGWPLPHPPTRVPKVRLWVSGDDPEWSSLSNSAEAWRTGDDGLNWGPWTEGRPPRDEPSGKNRVQLHIGGSSSWYHPTAAVDWASVEVRGEQGDEVLATIPLGTSPASIPALDRERVRVYASLDGGRNETAWAIVQTRGRAAKVDDDTGGLVLPILPATSFSTFWSHVAYGNGTLDLTDGVLRINRPKFEKGEATFPLRLYVGHRDSRVMTVCVLEPSGTHACPLHPESVAGSPWRVDAQVGWLAPVSGDEAAASGTLRWRPGEALGVVVRLGIWLEVDLRSMVFSWTNRSAPHPKPEAAPSSPDWWRIASWDPFVESPGSVVLDATVEPGEMAIQLPVGKDLIVYGSSSSTDYDNARQLFWVNAGSMRKHTHHLLPYLRIGWLHTDTSANSHRFRMAPPPRTPWPTVARCDRDIGCRTAITSGMPNLPPTDAIRGEEETTCFMSPTALTWSLDTFGALRDTVVLPTNHPTIPPTQLRCDSDGCGPLLPDLRGNVDPEGVMLDTPPPNATVSMVRFVYAPAGPRALGATSLRLGRTEYRTAWPPDPQRVFARGHFNGWRPGTDHMRPVASDPGRFGAVVFGNREVTSWAVDVSDASCTHLSWGVRVASYNATHGTWIRGPPFVTETRDLECSMMSEPGFYHLWWNARTWAYGCGERIPYDPNSATVEHANLYGTSDGAVGSAGTCLDGNAVHGCHRESSVAEVDEGHRLRFELPLSEGATALTYRVCLSSHEGNHRACLGGIVPDELDPLPRSDWAIELKLEQTNGSGALMRWDRPVEKNACAFVDLDLWTRTATIELGACSSQAVPAFVIALLSVVAIVNALLLFRRDVSRSQTTIHGLPLFQYNGYRFAGISPVNSGDVRWDTDIGTRCHPADVLDRPDTGLIVPSMSPRKPGDNLSGEERKEDTGGGSASGASGSGSAAEGDDVVIEMPSAYVLTVYMVSTEFELRRRGEDGKWTSLFNAKYGGMGLVVRQFLEMEVPETPGGIRVEFRFLFVLYDFDGEPPARDKVMTWDIPNSSDIPNPFHVELSKSRDDSRVYYLQSTFLNFAAQDKSRMYKFINMDLELVFYGLLGRSIHSAFVYLENQRRRKGTGRTILHFHDYHAMLSILHFDHVRQYGLENLRPDQPRPNPTFRSRSKAASMSQENLPLITATFHNAHYAGKIPVGKDEGYNQYVASLLGLCSVALARKFMGEETDWYIARIVIEYVRMFQDGHGITFVSDGYRLSMFHKWIWMAPYVDKFASIPNGIVRNSKPLDVAKLAVEKREAVAALQDTRGEQGSKPKGETETGGVPWYDPPYLHHNSKALVMTLFARQCYMKGGHIVANVVDHITSRMPSVQFVMAGPIDDRFGEFGARKVSEIRRNRPSQVLCLPKFVGNPERMFLLKAPAISWNPSLLEPCGIQDVEAAEFGALIAGNLVGGLGKAPGIYIVDMPNNPLAQMEVMKTLGILSCEVRMSMDDKTHQRWMELSQSLNFSMETCLRRHRNFWAMVDRVGPRLPGRSARENETPAVPSKDGGADCAPSKILGRMPACHSTTPSAWCADACRA